MNKFWIIISLLLVGATAFSVYQWLEVEASARELREMREQLNDDLAEMNRELAQKLKITQADELVLVGRYDSAMSMYESLAGSGLDENALKVRKQAIDERKQMMRELEGKDAEAYRRMMDIKERMAEELDMVRSQGELEKDSIINRLSDEISRLSDKIREYEENDASKAKVADLTFYSKSGTRTTYFGEVKNGKANGQGMGYYVTGNLYVGEWKDNYRHGEGGKFYWLSGERYEGAYIADRRKGHGTYYYANGDKYVGMWADDMQNGKGTLYDTYGNVKFEGEWKNGELIDPN